MSKITLAIDFGSAFTNIYMSGAGLVLSEPTVAAVSESEHGAVKFIGNEAKKLIGKTSKQTKIVFPVFEGEIVNEKVAVAVLGGFLKKIGVKSVFGLSALFSVPCGADANLIGKLKNVANEVGIKSAFFSEAPVLSALGQGIPLSDSSPCFVIDMADGSTNIAGVTLDGVIVGLSVNFGANKILTDIIDYVAEHNGLQIGLLTSERLKKEIGSLEDGDTLSAVVNGRDVGAGTPRAISLKASDIYPAVKTYYDKISEIALSVLKKLPPEVSAEITHAGIYLSGQGASVYGLSKYYRDKFGMQINIAENPSYSVCLGGGIVIGNKDLIKRVVLDVGM